MTNFKIHARKIKEQILQLWAIFLDCKTPFLKNHFGKRGAPSARFFIDTNQLCEDFKTLICLKVFYKKKQKLFFIKIIRKNFQLIKFYFAPKNENRKIKNKKRKRGGFEGVCRVEVSIRIVAKSGSSLSNKANQG